MQNTDAVIKMYGSWQSESSLMVVSNAFVQSGEFGRFCGAERTESGQASRRRREFHLTGQRSPSLPPMTAVTTRKAIQRVKYVYTRCFFHS